ncbi:MAG TPA: hypothetical protein VKJ00_15430 [Thermoanaerobaculia bacterium]|nr:hypothetical protein [Thermoanaerobaculia bacterium]
MARAVILAGLAASPALAQFQTGDVLAGVGAGKIKRFNPSGTLLQTIDSATTSDETAGMCFDASRNLFGTLFTISQVAKYDGTGTLLTNTFGGSYSNPESCVVDAAGNIFIGQAGSNQIRKVDPTGALLANFTALIGPRGTDWIDLASDQCTVHYTSEGNVIKQFNVCTNTQLADFATGLPSSPCYAHRIRPNGEELVACSSMVHRVSSVGTILQSYAGSGLTPPTSNLFALNLDPDGTSFWTGDINSGQVYRIDIGSGAQVTSWNAGIVGRSMAGLTVVGEIVVAQPTPTPTPARSPTPTPAIGPSAAVPAVGATGLLLLAGFLALAALWMLKR